MDDLFPPESDPFAPEEANDSEDTGFLDVFESVALGAQNTALGIVSVVADSAKSVALGAQDTVRDVASTAGETAEGVSANAAEAVNPFNLAGAAFGGTLGIVAVGVLAAFATDQLVFGGVGTMSLSRRLFSKRR